MVLAERQTPNHVLHLLLTIVTGGAWIIVWIILTLSVGPYRCPNCGAKTLGYVPKRYREALKKRHALT
ncbi:hypothetical protein ASC90_20440 [Rhizobium sp. Root1220]|nr:hypothetical protein ASC90_20440 [Rhizobium sp. Root1220]